MDCMGMPWRGGGSCGLCPWHVRATCLRVPWVIKDRWRWCPVALLGQVAIRDGGSGLLRCAAGSGPLGCGEPPCGATTSVVGPGRLGHRPPCAPYRVPTYRHLLGWSMMGGGECLSLRWLKMIPAMVRGP